MKKLTLSVVALAILAVALLVPVAVADYRANGYSDSSASIKSVVSGDLIVDNFFRVGASVGARLTIASGQTTGTLTGLDNVTASSLVIATINNTTTNAVSVLRAVPTAGQVAVVLSGDPGASGASITIFTAN